MSGPVRLFPEVSSREKMAKIVHSFPRKPIEMPLAKANSAPAHLHSPLRFSIASVQVFVDDSPRAKQNRMPLQRFQPESEMKSEMTASSRKMSKNRAQSATETSLSGLLR